MSGQAANPRPIQDPEGPLEQALIAEFLRMRGVEARARFVHELHGES